MKDEPFKIRLFRFIDVLPSVTDDRQTTPLIDEYFGDLPSLSAPLQWGLRALSATTLGARVGGQVLRRQILEMAKMFIAGTTVEDAEPTLVKLWKNGCACSIDLLGEASVSESEADHYVKRCRKALTLLGRDTASWPSSSLGTRSSRTPCLAFICRSNYLRCTRNSIPSTPRALIMRLRDASVHC